PAAVLERRNNVSLLLGPSGQVRAWNTTCSIRLVPLLAENRHVRVPRPVAPSLVPRDQAPPVVLVTLQLASPRAPHHIRPEHASSAPQRELATHCNRSLVGWSRLLTLIDIE